MILLIVLASILSYLAVAGFVFGYTRALWHIGGNGWDEPGPFFAGMLWPVFVLYASVSHFPNQVGYRVANHQIEKRRIRVEYQQKLRIELEQAERELEEQLMQDDDSETTSESRAVS